MGELKAWLATCLFTWAYKLDHSAVGELAVGIAPFYRVAMEERQRHGH